MSKVIEAFNRCLDSWDTASGKPLSVCCKCFPSENSNADDYMPQNLCDKHLLADYQVLLEQSLTKQFQILEVEFKLDGQLNEDDHARLMINRFLRNLYLNVIKERKDLSAIK